MLDWLTFSWFVGTCNLGHPATGPQEALWNTVNPYKTGPSGEPIKTGLLGRFPTLRKDDGDVESCCPPLSPHPAWQAM